MNHLSVSQLGMYSRCPESWRRRYAEGEIIPPGIAAIRGSGLHGAADFSMRWKAEYGTNTKPDELRDIAVARLDERLEDSDVLLTPDEKSVGRQIIIGQARDSVARMGHFWGCTTQTEYQPLDPLRVEERFTIPLPRLGIDFVGIIDLTDDQGRVVDWKTGKRSPSQRDADTSAQLTAYALWHHRRTGNPPAEVRLDAIIGGKETKRVLRQSHRNKLDYERLLERIKVTLQAIKAGVFPPCNPDDWQCSATWCGYWHTCKYRPTDK